MFVATGQVMAMRHDKNQMYEEGSILGIEQFLFGKAWEDDLYCSQAVTICKFRYDSLKTMANQNASAASRMFKRIMRHYCLEMVNLQSNTVVHNVQELEYRGIDDEDLFIDFKMDLKKPIELAVFDSLVKPLMP